MSKLDVVPVKRFGVAAMENWGLITGNFLLVLLVTYINSIPMLIWHLDLPDR